MRQYLLPLMLASMAAAQAQRPVWQHQLPETGLYPSAFSVGYISEMSERHGNSRLGMQTLSLTIPLSDPRRSSLYGWAFNAALESEVTFLDVSGDMALQRDTLCEFTLPLSVIRTEKSGNRLILAVVPMLATDFCEVERGLDLGAVASYTIRHSDSFSYSFGLGVAPRFARYGVVPFVGFEWKLPQDWTVSLRGYRLSAMHAFSERFSAGLFAAGTGGTWAVSTDDGARLLRVQSLVVGLAAEYDFSGIGQTKRLITASVGSAVATSARFYRRGSSEHSKEAHHYHPGVTATLGLDFRF